MGQKLHRGRRYGRRTAVRSVIGWLLAAALVIPGTFFAAKTIAARRSSPPAVDVGATTAGAPEHTTSATVPSAEKPSTYRGFYLPYTALRDQATLKTTADAAAAASFNCVVVELKNRAGELYYVSETEAGRTVNAAVSDALSLSALTEAFAVLQSAGIMPVARLYAFEDAVAPRTLAGAKVTTAGHADWTWYDGDPQNGGRPWLNPYADAAQSYLTALSEELYTAGAGGIMLDGVYFPTQTSQANFAVGDNAALSKGEVLRQFIGRVCALSNTAPVLLSCSANAALGNNMAAYTVNPLTLGAPVITPDLRAAALGKRVALDSEMLTVTAGGMADTVTRITAQLSARAAELSKEQPPVIVPLVGGDDAVAQIQALQEQAADISYFWYREDGNYPFADLT